MDGVLKFYNAEKYIVVTLTPNDSGYDFVIVGDENKVSDDELFKMTGGESFGDWEKQ